MRYRTNRKSKIKFVKGPEIRLNKKIEEFRKYYEKEI